MRGAASPLLALLLAAGAPAHAEEAATPGSVHAFAGEVSTGGSLCSLHGLRLVGWDLRLALGGRQSAEAAFRGRLPAQDNATWLVTAGLFQGHTPAGLRAGGLRLGAGVRYRSGRLTAGIDTEWVRLAVARASAGGELRATGIGVRLLGALDVVRLGGDVAALAYLAATLDEFDPLGGQDILPALQGGVALRW